ncbi:MAG: hypothetical protein GY736_04400 [Sphingomonas sp.]|jgi:hypothetical protein|uniref:hypothetical protein n=1 Tax=Sphingomonas sp. TaxID=28214 RepID=UPI00258C88C0|nr:hypothetical protein [Sphingomonas sp.]MCP4025541.1 hypothetical protein [Sphingomonas sp.]
MNTIIMATLAASLGASAASATTPDNGTQAGHWEWRAATQAGPRAPLQPARRVWVSDVPQATACACPMMERSSDACMSMKGGRPG